MQADCDAAIVDINLGGHPVSELAAGFDAEKYSLRITGYGRDGVPREFREAIVLKKPFSRDELLATVELLFYQIASAKTASVVQLRTKSR